MMYIYIYSLFAQYKFCVAGVGLGAAYGIRLKKGPAPMIIAGLGGSLADIIYGYTMACQDEVQAYQNYRNGGSATETTIASTTTTATTDEPPPNHVG